MDIERFSLGRNGKSINAQQIVDFEIKYDLKLPEDYKKIVLERFNGGSPAGASTIGTSYYISVRVKMGFPDVIHEYNTNVSVLYLHPLEQLDPDFCPAYTEDVEASFGQLEAKYKKFLLIGDGEDSCFMLGIAEENFGQVFLWLGHEEEEHNPHLAADSFLDFIDKIKVDNPQEDFSPNSTT